MTTRGVGGSRGAKRASVARKAPKSTAAGRARRGRTGPPAKKPWKWEQTDLFPEPVEVHELDPLQIAGPRSQVKGIWKVLIGHERAVHMVFADRHGRYCAEHGRECRAVVISVGN